MRIGNIDLCEKPVLLAPMEDVTDESFRLICREQGADMTYTEFVSADALIRNIPSTTRKLHINDKERPCAIQIYGKDVPSMVEAAQLAEAASPDIIDINFGCPVKKIARHGAGAGMLRDVPKMLQITSAVVKAVKCPVTVKTRLGWDCENIIIADLAEKLQDCGISALTIHGRTRSQMYTGNADWETIGRVKSNPRLNIPIIGNGDITDATKALDVFEKYGVDAVMIGRGAIGAPWIFNEIKHFIANGEKKMLSTGYKLSLLWRQIKESVEKNNEKGGILHIRRHLASSPLFKNIPNFRNKRIEMLRADSYASLETVLNEIERIYL